MSVIDWDRRNDSERLRDMPDRDSSGSPVLPLADPEEDIDLDTLYRERERADAEDERDTREQAAKRALGYFNRVR